MTEVFYLYVFISCSVPVRRPMLICMRYLQCCHFVASAVIRMLLNETPCSSIRA